MVTVAYTSCKKADDMPPQPKVEDEYFPLEIGKWVIYNVDSTVWDDTFCVKKFYHHQMMHFVADTFTDDKGRMSYRIETRIRFKPEDPWQYHDVIYATNTGVNLEVAYDQLRFIKLIFPIKEGDVWKGNNLITTEDPEFAYLADWDYQYHNVGNEFNTDYKVFDNTVTVTHIDEAISDPEVFPFTYASRTKSEEVYASGVGMIYREYYRWIYDPKITKCRKGTGVEMRAVDHN